MQKVTVKPLFRGAEYKTTVWIAEDVAELLELYLDEGGKEALRWLDKAEYYAKAGFARHEGPKGGIRSKWGQVYAIQPWATLFRLYGFYEQPQKRDFIVVSTTMKKGQKMRDHDKREVDYAVLIRESGAWEKDETVT
ncbi:MAG: hypothetical protein KIS87_05130 [Phycisphaeraceae bacterium]|nr:hypothetical protein [Phycisphaeraceae bacterium]